MANKNKEFNYGLYAVVAFTLVAAILATTTVFTFKNKYIAFSPEKVATNYVDTIVQKGDGYNAYKFALVSKSEKYGDFIRENYIYPVIWPGYVSGGDEDANKAAKENGFDTDAHKSDATKNDDGSLAGNVAEKMYPYYVELMKTVSWDDYDTFFSSYMERLVAVRAEVFGDDYMSDEVFFTALEANVATFGDALTGTDTVYAADGKTTISEATVGLYQQNFGTSQTAEVIGEGGELVETTKLVYKLVTTAGEPEEFPFDAYKESLDPDELAKYGLTADDITAVQLIPVTVSTEEGTELATVEVFVAQIGNSWFVDSTITDMSEVYTRLMSGVTAPAAE